MANKIFIDTNIALDILFSDRVNSDCTKDFILKQNAKLVINDLSLNNIFYIGSKIDYKVTFDFLKNITINSNIWQVYYLRKRDLIETFDLMDRDFGADFEDLQQYVSAKNSDCQKIISNDRNFPKLDISVVRTNLKIDNYIK